MFNAATFTIESAMGGALGPLGSSTAAVASGSQPSPMGALGVGPLSQDAPGKPPAPKITICPMTVKSALSASKEGDKFQYCGVTLQKVLLIGQVMKMDTTLTSTELVLDDSTDQVSVTFYSMDGGEDLNVITSSVKRLMYAQVVGMVATKKGDGSRFIRAIKITPVTDKNMIVHHLAESVYTYLDMCRKSAGQDTARRVSLTEAPVSSSAESKPFRKEEATGDVVMGTTSSTPAPSVAVKSDVDFKTLFKQLQAVKGDAGCTLQDLIVYCGGKGMSAEAVESALEELKEALEVFPTIDEEHFAFAD